VVLRHELGHNFGKVGEEYDGGQVYQGANAATTLAQVDSKWGVWLSQRPARAEDSTIRLQDYPWYLLENGPKVYTFTSDGSWSRWFMRFTASGCPEAGSLAITLDGSPLQWIATGVEDRSFYNYFVQTGFSAGSHTLRFEQTSAPTGEFKRQLCSLTIHEYKAEPIFHWSNSWVSGYRTWRLGGALAGYRPTNEYCLMRNMTSPSFCDVCIENNWLQFFRTVNLIDNITATCTATTATVTLNAIPLGSMRQRPLRNGLQELYELKWYINNQEAPALEDTYEWSVQRSTAVGTWRAELRFITPQIRQDPTDLTLFSRTITIPATGPC